MRMQNSTVIDVYTGSQYFIQDGQGHNKMVKPDQLLLTLENLARQDNFKRIVVTMYLEVEREVKIIGDTRYFEYLTRNETGAKFVMEKHDVIHEVFRFNSDASALVCMKGQILTPGMTLDKPPVEQKEVKVMTDKQKAVQIENKTQQKPKEVISTKDVDDITDTLKSMSFTKKSETSEKQVDYISQLVNDLTKNVMDSTITTFIQEFIANYEKNMDQKIFTIIIGCLQKNGWQNNGFDNPPNKQKIINDLCDIMVKI